MISLSGVLCYEALFFGFCLFDRPTYGVMFRRTLKRQIQHNKSPFLMNQEHDVLVVFEKRPACFYTSIN